MTIAFNKDSIRALPSGLKASLAFGDESLEIEIQKNDGDIFFEVPAALADQQEQVRTLVRSALQLIIMGYERAGDIRPKTRQQAYSYSFAHYLQEQIGPYKSTQDSNLSVRFHY